jgi:hypothetical protein
MTPLSGISIRTGLSDGSELDQAGRGARRSLVPADDRYSGPESGWQGHLMSSSRRPLEARERVASCATFTEEPDVLGADGVVAVAGGARVHDPVVVRQHCEPNSRSQAPVQAWRRARGRTG